MSDSASHSRNSTVVAVSEPGPWIAVAAVTGLVIWVFWDFLFTQVRLAIEKQADWGHTLVIPAIAGYFVYVNRHRLAAITFRTAWWSGFTIIIIGAALYLAATLGPEGIRHHNIQGFGLGVVLFGICALFFGWRAMAVLWFPIAYLVLFGQTVSERLMNIVTERLQDMAARGSYHVLVLFGLDVSREGNVLTIFEDGQERPLNIAEACSGMRMVMAFLALAVAMGYTGFRRFWQRASLVVMAIPTAIFVNILRVVTLALLSLVDSGLAAGDFHTFIGLVWLVPAFIIFLGIMWIIRHLVIESPRPAGEQKSASVAGIEFDRRAKPALVSVCALLVLCGLGAQWTVNWLNIYLKKEPVELRHPFVAIPQTLGQWKMIDEIVLDPATIETLGTDIYLDRVYAIGGDRTKSQMAVHAAYYTGMLDAVPHIPDRCFAAAGLEAVAKTRNHDLAVDQSGWDMDSGIINNATGKEYPTISYAHRITGSPIQVLLPIGDFRLRMTEFHSPEQGNARVYAGFSFVTNGRTTAEPGKIRLMAFDKKDRFAYYAKVQFTMYGNRNTQPEDFLARVSDIYSHLLPELMRCLPDWSEVESRGASAP